MVFNSHVSRNYVLCSVRMKKPEEKKLAAVNRDNEVNCSKKSWLPDTDATGLKKEDKTQVSEDVEEKVFKKPIQEFRGTDCLMLGTLPNSAFFSLTSHVFDAMLNSSEDFQDF